MGMMIDEAITWLNTDDYESKGFADATIVAIETMRKYQKIKQLVNQAEYAGENNYTGEAEWILTDSVYQKIREILEDGNDD